MKKLYYFVTCNSIDIYEYLKLYLSSHDYEKIWEEFKVYKEVMGLKKQIVHTSSNYNYYSLFKKRGFDKFMEIIYPLVLKYINSKVINVKTIKVSSKDIVDENDYQVIVKTKRRFKSKIINIINLMGTINYGFLDKEGINIFALNNVEQSFNENYYLMPPQETLNKKVGTCFDQVELERKLFSKIGIKTSSYFLCFKNNDCIISHTFLVYELNQKFYWFEHAWYDEVGIHEFECLYDLLRIVELKFLKSHKKEIDKSFDEYIFKYERPKFNISSQNFYNYIFKQKRVINYKLIKATSKDFERLKKYMLANILKFSKDLTNDEVKKINLYVNNEISNKLDKYKNIIYKDVIIGSILISKIKRGLLIEEIYIEDNYRNKGIGSYLLNDIILSNKKDIYLWVYKDNKLAVKLYKSLGFNILQKTKTRYYMVCNKSN